MPLRAYTLFALLAALLFPGAGLSQSLITTVTGTDWIFASDGNPAVTAPLGTIYGVAVGPDQTLYISDWQNRMVMSVGGATLHVIAGNGIAAYSGEGGPAVNASLNSPVNAAAGSDGSLYITDQAGQRVHRIGPDGVISTIAGNGKTGLSASNIPATSAALNRPFAIAVDAMNNVYFTDRNNHRVCKIGGNGMITTVAGSGTQGFSGDGGPATAAKLSEPAGIAVAGDGTIYISDYGSNRIRRVNPSGVISTYVGNGLPGGFIPEGTVAADARLANPMGLALDSSGTLYIADFNAFYVLKVTPDGKVFTVAGNSAAGTSELTPDQDNAPAKQVTLDGPAGVALDSVGNIYIADSGRHLIRKVDTNGFITTVAGAPGYRAIAHQSDAIRAFLFRPTGIAFNPDGTQLYIADTDAQRVDVRTSSGLISVAAGTGEQGCCRDTVLEPITTAALSALLDSPSGVAVDASGNLYVSDTNNDAVWEFIAETGSKALVAGNAPGLVVIPVSKPKGLAFDSQQRLYIADSGNHVIRRIDGQNMSRIVAGTGHAGAAVSGVLATNSPLSTPSAVAINSAGDVLIADTGNHQVQIVRGGILTTVAGTGAAGYSGDGGSASRARLNSPTAVATDRTGNIYVADTGNNVVRVIDPSGVISTFAGNGAAGFSGDGGAPELAALNSPSGVAVDAAGVVYIADSGNNRIRAVFRNLAVVTGLSVNQLVFGAAIPGGALPPAASVTISTSIPGYPYTVTSSDPWLKVTPVAGTAPATLQVEVDPAQVSQLGIQRAQLIVTTPSSRSTVSVQFTVLGAPPTAKLAVDPAAIAFSYAAGASASSRQFFVLDQGGGKLVFTVSPAAPKPPWLMIHVASLTTDPNTPAAVLVTADPTGLPPGVYRTSVTIASEQTHEQQVVPVVMTITAAPQVMQLSQTVVAFTAVQGGPAPPSQTFAIASQGSARLSWSAAIRTADGPAWLMPPSPSAGASDPGGSLTSLVTLTVDPSGLKPGSYTKQVQVTAPDAINAPQSVVVTLRIVAAADDPGPIAEPLGLLFAGVSGSASPGSQSIRLTSLGKTYSWRAAVSLDKGRWLTVAPTDGTVTPGQPANIVVQPDPGGLAPGIYTGAITFQFTPNAVRTVNVQFRVQPAKTVSPGLFEARAAVPGCAPDALLLGFAQMGGGSSGAVGFSPVVQVRAIDSCGSPVTAGSVVARFDVGGSSELRHRGNGLWEGIFSGSASQTDVRVNITATASGLTGNLQQSFRINPDPTSPRLRSPGIVNQASQVEGAPLASGTSISIFGQNLATGIIPAQTPPLPLQAAGASIRVAGQDVAFSSIQTGRIDAVLPFRLASNTSLQMLIQQGDAVIQEFIPFADAQPAIFSQDGSGAGQGRIFGIAPDGSRFLAEPATPAAAGSQIVIQCTGLGSVTAPPDPGADVPPNTVTTNVPVSVQIGTVTLPDAPLGTLVAGAPGLYEVLVTVPMSIASSDTAPVTITVAGQTSPAVTMAVRRAAP